MKKILGLWFFFGVLLAYNVALAQTSGTLFFVDASYDSSSRSTLSATPVFEGARATFFVDDEWWGLQSSARQDELKSKAQELSREFDAVIYPTLTSVFGSEWTPGVDGNIRITVLIHSMRQGAGGYFRTADEYLQLQAPQSNEREMVYISAAAFENANIKAFLAHEFTHLITFNQKDRLRDVAEEEWFNEGRAEYAPTLLGYNNPYEKSILQNRVGVFLADPANALLEWKGTKEDYGVLSMFIHYLVDQYGITALSESMQSQKVGVASLMEILKRYGTKESFGEIFTNWMTASFLNDCSYGTRLCYYNQNLANIRLAPTMNFLPLTGQSTLSVSNITKDWSGHWDKVVGGKGVLRIAFSGLKGLQYRVAYITQDQQGTYTVELLSLDANAKGEVYIPKFGTDVRAVFVLSALTTHETLVNGNSPTYPYTLSMGIAERTPLEEAELIKELLAQIESIKKQIAELQAKTAVQERGKSLTPCAKAWESNLGRGMRGREVECLQEFLARQGGAIYPEGWKTGYFGEATARAVARFQEKYFAETLQPAGLSQGTGYAGPLTREKIKILDR